MLLKILSHLAICKERRRLRYETDDEQGDEHGENEPFAVAHDLFDAKPGCRTNGQEDGGDGGCLLPDTKVQANDDTKMNGINPHVLTERQQHGYDDNDCR